MCHHRDTSLHEEFDGVGQDFRTLQLDRVAAGTRQDLCAIAVGLLWRFLITAERHIGDHAGQPGAVDHGPGMGDGFFQAHVQGG
ncbi:hypothetical protein D3C80_1985720 [compost metagenome]